MTTLELTPEDVDHLHFILGSYLSDLRMEIVDTEQHEFREMLKRREEFIKRLLDRLPAPR
jgi:hypothetical protein